MKLRRPLSLFLIAMLIFSTSVILLPAGNAVAGNGPTLEARHGQDDNGTMDDAVTFLVRIENISGNSDLPTPFAPGVWALHSEAGPLFTTGEADRGYGLEALAEDGDPAQLAEALLGMDLHAGVFNTPVGSEGPGALLPGSAYEFEVQATPDTPYLSFATMFVQSNDLFVGPDEMGIALFDSDGMAMADMQDVTAYMLLWDAGTEANEEPGAGDNQAPRQSDANTGPADGMATVHVVDDEFSYPDVASLLYVTIEQVMMADDEEMMDEEEEMATEDDGMMSEDDEMATEDDGMMSEDDEMATEDDGMMSEDDETDTVMLMEDGHTTYTVVAGDTLGSIALRAYGSSRYWSTICSASALEDCDTIQVGDELTLPSHTDAMSMMGESDEMMPKDDGMKSDDAMMTTDDDGMKSDDAMMTTDDDGMKSEDAMMTTDDDGMKSDDAMMTTDDAMMDTIMLMEDGHTTYTVVAGDTLGSIASRAYGHSKYWSTICSASGLDDCDTIQIGDELTLPTHTEAMSMMGESDEMMPEGDGMMDDPVTFLVRIENISGDSDLPTPFAPGVWALHNEAGPLFTTGEADRGYGLEALAEDGDPAQLAEALRGMDLHAGVFNTPAGAEGAGVLMPGGAYEFEVHTTRETPYLSFATMFVQSNDLFVGPDEMGISLFDIDGMAMAEVYNVTSHLLLWDAGTEANEEPGAGDNQAPRQSDANTGPADGMATVHVVDDEFSYPDVTALVHVTIEQVMMADDEEMMDEDKEMMTDDKEMMTEDDKMMTEDAMMDTIMLMEDGPTTYTVVAGDSLTSIAYRAYGSSKYWSIICSASALEDCDIIYVGVTLTLPSHTDAMSMMGETGEMDEMDEMDKMDKMDSSSDE